MVTEEEPRRSPELEQRRSHQGAPQLARSAAPATARITAPLAAVARPAGQVAGLLLVEVLRSLRARTAALGVVRLRTGLLGDARLPRPSSGDDSAGTVEQDSGTGVLIHRAETALVG